MGRGGRIVAARAVSGLCDISIVSSGRLIILLVDTRHVFLSFVF